MEDLKFNCVSCEGPLSIDESQFVKSFETRTRIWGQEIECPHCGRQTRIYKTQNGEKTQGGAVVEKKISSQLEYIRQNTSYRVLRKVINVTSGLAIAAEVLVAAILIVGDMSASSGENSSPSIGPDLITAAAAALAVVLTIAAWQSALLLVDIADTLLIEHSKAKEPK